MTPEECALSIQQLTREVDSRNAAIDRIAATHIEDFHFLDHIVSRFWRCPTSPIGMCVFTIDHDHPSNRRGPLCRYCQNPTERK